MAGANREYMVVENCSVTINGVRTNYQKNLEYEYGETGAIIGVTCDNPTEIAMNDAVQNLIDTGVLVDLGEADSQVPT